MNKILFKNALTADSDFKKKVDIFVENGIIKKISPFIKPLSDTDVYDLKGMCVFAGFIDPHCHFSMKTSQAFTADDFESGSMALVSGGTTVFGDFTDGDISDPCTDVKRRLSEVKDVFCDYFFHAVIKNVNDVKDLERRFKKIKKAGIKSIKIFTAYGKRGMRFNEKLMPYLFEFSKKYSVVICVHAEDDDIIEYNLSKIKGNKIQVRYHSVIRDEFCENYSVTKILKLNEKFSAPVYFVHISSYRSLELIKYYHDKGYPVFAETCPQYIIFDSSVYNKKDGYLFTFTPPVHSYQNRKLLLSSLKYFDTIATDSCSFMIKDKKKNSSDLLNIPMGISSAGLTASIIYSYGVMNGFIKPSDMEKLLSTNAACIFSIPNRGQLKEGFYADIVVFNPNKSFVVKNSNLYTKSDYSCYEGIELKGRVESVYIRGKKVFDSGSFDRSFKGRYLNTNLL